MPPRNALYRNDGEGGFEDVTEKAGVAGKGYGMGMTAGDVDNDGDLDLYVTELRPERLLSEPGRRHVRRPNPGKRVWWREAGARAPPSPTTTPTGTWTCTSPATSTSLSTTTSSAGIRRRTSRPTAIPTSTIRFPGSCFRDEGTERFADVTREAGVYVEDEGKGLGVVWGDYDNDGDRISTSPTTRCGTSSSGTRGKAASPT